VTTSSNGSLSVRRDALGSDTVLHLAGELDLATAPQLDEAISSTVAEHLVLDLSDLSFIDSSGISLLVVAIGDERPVTLRNPQPTVSRVLELTGLDHLVERPAS
jgi:anti-sigma B factor antagonist